MVNVQMAISKSQTHKININWLDEKCAGKKTNLDISNLYEFYCTGKKSGQEHCATRIHNPPAITFLQTVSRKKFLYGHNCLNTVNTDTHTQICQAVINTEKNNNKKLSWCWQQARRV